jgi:Homeodomain-like domain
VKKYIVRLTPDERDQLLRMVRSGKAAARTLLPARILLKADDGPETAAWSDEAIREALEGHATTVARMRQRLVEEGLEAALRPQPTTRQYEHKLDGAAEAHLIALACGPAPEGQAQWTLRLLADKRVELQHVTSISHETVRRTLKKTNCSRTGSSTGRFRPHIVPSLSPPWKMCWKSTNVRWIRPIR